MLSPENQYFDKLFAEKVSIHGLPKVLYLTTDAKKLYDEHFYKYYQNNYQPYR
jgi:hypothetical protein